MMHAIRSALRSARYQGRWAQAKRRSAARNALALAVHDVMRAALPKPPVGPVAAPEPIGLGNGPDPVLMLAESLAVRYGWNRPTAIALAQAS